MKKSAFLILLLSAFLGNPVHAQQRNWPVITGETKPWTRWWWHGSAVNPADLTASMEEMRKPGLAELKSPRFTM